MLDTWWGGWDSGSSYWALGGETGIVDLHVGDLGRGVGIVDFHVGHLGGGLG